MISDSTLSRIASLPAARSADILSTYRQTDPTTVVVMKDLVTLAAVTTALVSPVTVRAAAAPRSSGRRRAPDNHRQSFFQNKHRRIVKRLRSAHGQIVDGTGKLPSPMLPPGKKSA